MILYRNGKRNEAFTNHKETSNKIVIYEGDMSMGHIRTDMAVRGEKGSVKLKNVLIDTGATYTVLPEKV